MGRQSVRLIVAKTSLKKARFGAHIAAWHIGLAVKRRGRRPATPYKWEIYEDDKLVEQSLEYFPSKGKAVESGTKVLLRLRIRKAQELGRELINS